MPETATDIQDALADLPVHTMSDERRGAMRFALMAAARSRPRRRPSRYLLAAAAAALFGIAALTWSRDTSEVSIAERPPPPVPVAAVELASGARGDSLAGARLYRLFEGSASFDVPRLTSGEHYRVIAGDGLVEVRGTRFEVDVDGGRLAAVRVHRGHVLVFVEDERVADLHAGGEWGRGVQGGEGPEPASSPEAPAPTAFAATTETKTETPTRDPTADSAFERAFALLRAGHASRAARRLDALVERSELDPGRSADVLYWAAVAHERAGQAEEAEERAQRLLSRYPDAWRAADARRLLLRVRQR